MRDHWDAIERAPEIGTQDAVKGRCVQIMSNLSPPKRKARHWAVRQLRSSMFCSRHYAAMRLDGHQLDRQHVKAHGDRASPQLHPRLGAAVSIPRTGIGRPLNLKSAQKVYTMLERGIRYRWRRGQDLTVVGVAMASKRDGALHQAPYRPQTRRSMD